MRNFKDYTLEEFSQAISAPTPTPGGGASAALSASIGISLGGMVASLTAINKKYTDVKADMDRLLERSESLQKRFLDLIEKDARAYEPLSKAYKMPKNNEEEISSRDEAIQDSLINACLIPIEIMKACCEAIDLLAELSEKGSMMVLSDVGAGVMLMRSALNTASINVFINLKNMKDKKRESEIRSKTNELLIKYTPYADHIYNNVLEKIS